jgi:GNAT superfamily N-acetyltransferase
MYHDRKVAEIGNNAVSPAHQGHGVGAQMYVFVLERMREAGMKAAIVTTGGDDAHAPARRAYEKVGFSGAVPSLEYHIEL